MKEYISLKEDFAGALKQRYNISNNNVILEIDLCLYVFLLLGLDADEKESSLRLNLENEEEDIAGYLPTTNYNCEQPVLEPTSEPTIDDLHDENCLKTDSKTSNKSVYNNIVFNVDGIKCRGITHLYVTNGIRRFTFLVVEKKDAASLLKVLEEVKIKLEQTRKKKRMVKVFPEHYGYRLPDIITWDDMFISDSVKTFKKDIEFFLFNKNWFEKNGIPYKRGYLLYGEPGTGKTMTIKSLMGSYKDLAICTCVFGDSDFEASTFMELFNWATKNKPALIVLEDFDRLFNKETKESRTSIIDVSTVLNVMDGMINREGTIVVATVNNKAILERSLYARPGRFDKIIEFNNPTPENISQFLSSKFKNVGIDTINSTVEKLRGWSYAQLANILVESGNIAYDSADKIIDDKIYLKAIESLLKYKMAEKRYGKSDSGLGFVK